MVGETREVAALVAYVQKLGMTRGRWRDAAEPEEVEGGGIELPRSPERIAHGKAVFERRCVACHGVEGNGNGEAATFTYRQRPRNFTTGVFKFRLVKGPVPTDRDLLRTISRGVRGTAMPAWYWLPLEDRLDVIQYIKYELAVDRSDPPEAVRLFYRGTSGRGDQDRGAAGARRPPCWSGATRSGSRRSAGNATARAAAVTARRRRG